MVECEVLTGNRKGEAVFLPLISCVLRDSDNLSSRPLRNCLTIHQPATHQAAISLTTQATHVTVYLGSSFQSIALSISSMYGLPSARSKSMSSSGSNICVVYGIRGK